MTWSKFAPVAMLAGLIAGTMPAAAGDYNGNMLVRVQGTLVAPDSSANVNIDPTANADVSTEVIPTLTLTYFLNKNIAAELFCCFAKFDAKGTAGAVNGVDLGNFWVFPPIVTLQYHFDPISGFKPYVGAGVEYMHFFDGGMSGLGQKIKLDDGWGFALQAGVDVEIGQGWYLNADVKHVWMDTNAKWGNIATADVTVDPWIVSLGVGYRFNLSDLLGDRGGPAPLK